MTGVTHGLCGTVHLRFAPWVLFGFTLWIPMLFIGIAIVIRVVGPVRGDAVVPAWPGAGHWIR